MGIADMLLPEFDQEMMNTRKTLERIPEEKLGWKPHEKSMSMIHLATHLAEIMHWSLSTLRESSFDVAPPDAPPYRTTPAHSRQEVLERFDQNVAEARGLLATTTDEQFFQPWSLLAGGKTLMSMPRVAVFRAFILSHSIHHRAQLGVYLRLNDVPVPAIYGPSADERGM